jgi:hypothetical protein
MRPWTVSRVTIPGGRATNMEWVPVTREKFKGILTDKIAAMSPGELRGVATNRNGMGYKRPARMRSAPRAERAKWRKGSYKRAV